MLSTVVLVLMMTGKPLCNQKTEGQMWPTIANEDQGMFLSLARAEALQVCVQSALGYEWEHLTVKIRQGKHATEQ